MQNNKKHFGSRQFFLVYHLLKITCIYTFIPSWVSPSINRAPWWTTRRSSLVSQPDKVILQGKLSHKKDHRVLLGLQATLGIFLHYDKLTLFYGPTDVQGSVSFQIFCRIISNSA